MYEPAIFHGSTVEELSRYVETELRNIALDQEQERNYVILKKTHVEPGKKLEGLCVWADGTDWNPGAGEGVYQVRSGAWVKIG